MVLEDSFEVEEIGHKSVSPVKNRKQQNDSNFPRLHDRTYSNPVTFTSTLAFVNLKPKDNVQQNDVFKKRRDDYREVADSAKEEAMQNIMFPNITTTEERDEEYMNNPNQRRQISSPYSRKRSGTGINIQHSIERTSSNQSVSPKNKERVRPSTSNGLGDRLALKNLRPTYLTADIPSRARPTTANRAVSLSLNLKEPLGVKDKKFVLPSQILKQPPKPTVDIRFVEIREPCRPPIQIFFSDFYLRKPLTKLSLSCWIIGDEEIATVASKCKQLVELDIPGCGITDEGMKLLDECKELVKINLNYCTGISIVGFKAFVKTHSKITTLLLQCSSIDNESVSYIMFGLKRLEEINLRGCQKLTDFALTAIGERPFGFYPLKKIDLRDNNNFTDKGTLVLLGGVRRAQVLDLRGCKKLSDLTFMSCVAQKGKLFLWKTMNMYELNITDVGLNWLTEGCRLLSSVSLDSCKEITDRGIQSLFENVKGLTDLNLALCGFITDECMKDIPQLKILNLTDCYQLTDVAVEQIAICCADSLNTLVIVGMNNITNNSFKYLGEHCKCLEVINLSGRAAGANVGMQAFYGAPKISDAAARYLAHGKSKKTIKSIFFGCLLRLTDVALEEFGKGLEALESLAVNSCIRITDNGVSVLAKHCSTLKKLNLSKVENISNKSLAALGAGCPNLVNLDIFSADKVTDEGVESLVCGCKNIEVINFHWVCKLTDKSLESLAKHCTKLTSLNLEALPLITDKGINQVAQANKNLVDLRLQGCDKITHNGLKEIHEKYLHWTVPSITTFGLRPKLGISGFKVREEELRRQLSWHHAAIKIQVHYRGLVSRRKTAKLAMARTIRKQKILEEKKRLATIEIQRVWRGRLGRIKFAKYKRQRIHATANIQRVWRGYLGRCIASRKKQEKKDLKAKRWRASKKIQIWYRGIVQMSIASVLLKERREEYKRHSKAARLIQRVYRGHLGRKKAKDKKRQLQRLSAKAVQAALIIQTNYRAYKARVFVGKRRIKYNYAANIIQRNYKGWCARRWFTKRVIVTGRAALRIQTNYRARRARVDFKIRVTLKRQQDVIRDAAARKIQKAARHFIGQNKVKLMRLIRMKKKIENLAANEIQRVYRGYRGRKRAKVQGRINKIEKIKTEGLGLARKRRMIRMGAATIIQNWYKPFFKAKKQKKFLQELRWDSAIIIQACGRGYLGRKRAKKYREERTEAAKRIQNKYRYHLAKKVWKQLIRQRNIEREEIRRQEQKEKAEARKKKEFQEKLELIFFRSKEKAVIIIQRCTREFLKIKKAKREVEEKRKREENTQRMLENANNENIINVNMNDIRSRAKDVTDNVSKGFLSVLGFGGKKEESKPEELLSDEEFLKRENYKREETALARREMVTNIKSFFSKDAREEQAKKLQEKINYSILAKQKILVHQVGVAAFEITVGYYETQEFKKTQLLEKNAGRPYFMQIEIDLGQLHVDYNLHPPARKSLEVFLWYSKTTAARLVTSFEFVRRPLPPQVKPDEWEKKRLKDLTDKGFIIGTHRKSNFEIRGVSTGKDPIVDMTITLGSEMESQLEKMGFTNYNMDPSPFVCGQVEARGLVTYVKYVKIEKEKSQVRLEGHINEEKFYNDKVQDQMDFLGLGEYEVRAMHKIFRKMDANGSGTVSCDEMIAFIGEKLSPLAIELFHFLEDSCNDGEWHFAHFLHAVSTLCMWGRKELLAFCFTFFDKDKSGIIDPDELRELIKIQAMGAPTFLNTRKILEETHIFDAAGGIKFEEFDEFDKKYPLLLYPIFRIQTALQKTCLGLEFWEDRKALFIKGRAEIKKERKLRADRPPEEILILEVGMRVEAKYQGAGDYLEGTITYANKNGTFTILFKKKNMRDPKVKRENIRKFIEVSEEEKDEKGEVEKKEK